MDLKDRKIGLLIVDWPLRIQLSQLLMKNGAIVHGAQDAEQLQDLVEKLGVESIIPRVSPPPASLSLN